MVESEEVGREIERVLVLIAKAIEILDTAAAPSDIAVHLDSARIRALEELDKLGHKRPST